MFEWGNQYRAVFRVPADAHSLYEAAAKANVYSTAAEKQLATFRHLPKTLGSCRTLLYVFCFWIGACVHIYMTYTAYVLANRNYEKCGSVHSWIKTC